MLVGAMNPCPCGFLGDLKRECNCTPAQVMGYRSRLSGPLLDRIDIHCDVPAVRFKELSGERSGECSDEIRMRVDRARGIQSRRFSGAGIFSNSRMGPMEIREFCRVDRGGMALLQGAVEKLGLSARAYTRVLKVARTIADLDGSGAILPPHVSEAIQYRTLDRTLVH
jgi:magnesium chelatase family protein